MPDLSHQLRPGGGNTQRISGGNEMNLNSGMSERAIRRALIGLAAHQLELEKETDGLLTDKQVSSIRSTLYFFLPVQDGNALTMWWDTVVSQQRIRQDIKEDAEFAVLTYTGQEFARPDEITALDNEAIRDTDYALDQLLHPKPFARLAVAS